MGDRAWVLKSGETVATWEPVTGGGSSYTPPTDRESFVSSVDVAPGGTGHPSFSEDQRSGAQLLSYTDPQHPTILTAGVYAWTLSLEVASFDSTGETGEGVLTGTIEDSPGSISIAIGGHFSFDYSSGVPLLATWSATKYMAAGIGLADVAIHNLISVWDQTFVVLGVLQRIS